MLLICNDTNNPIDHDVLNQFMQNYDKDNLKLPYIIMFLKYRTYKAIKSYKLPDKRLEKLHDGKFKIFKDFAHSPSKLNATINAVKSQYNNNLLVIYELHSSSSFDVNFLKNYKDTLLKSTFSIIYISENKKSNHLSEKFLMECFNEKKLVLIKSKSQLIDTIKTSKFKNYNKLLMSSGNFDDLDFNILIT